jgi:hypothetical protein
VRSTIDTKHPLVQRVKVRLIAALIMRSRGLCIPLPMQIAIICCFPCDVLSFSHPAVPHVPVESVRLPTSA